MTTKDGVTSESALVNVRQQEEACHCENCTFSDLKQIF